MPKPRGLGMTWIALAERDGCRLSLRGLGADKQPEPTLWDRPDTLLTRGTLMMETRLAAAAGPQVLFGYSMPGRIPRSLRFETTPNGGIAMIQRQGETTSHAAITPPETGRTDVLRITYTWDSTARWGRLTLERPGEADAQSSAVPAPCPLPLEDLRLMMLGRGDRAFAAEMIFAALSTRIEPIGPSPSLHPETPIATATGYRPVAELRRGDTVRVADGQIIPVLHPATRVVPARGSFAPVRLRAPYFGLQQDLIVAPDQRVLIDGPEVEYLFNQEAVLVPARHLANGHAAVEEPCGPVIRYDQIVLPGHETLDAAGMALESLYIGRLRRKPDLLAGSVLSRAERATLPEHRRPRHQILRWHEAVHLISRRAA